jgi:hypothetical protein
VASAQTSPSGLHILAVLEVRHFESFGYVVALRKRRPNFALNLTRHRLAAFIGGFAHRVLAARAWRAS